jgi:hypothetical protein
MEEIRNSHRRIAAKMAGENEEPARGKLSDNSKTPALALPQHLRLRCGARLVYDFA